MNILTKIKLKTNYVTKNFYHKIAESCLRTPNILFVIGSRSKQTNTALIESLHEKGIIKLDYVIPPEKLSKLKEQFDSYVNEISNSEPGPELSAPEPWTFVKYKESHFDKEINTIHSHNPFKTFDFLDMVLNEKVLEIVDSYFGKKTMLSQAILSRYLPMESKDFGSWQWHHDGWGKRLNVMFLLTDVTINDQYMSYLEGSHKCIWNLDRIEKSRFSNEEVANEYSSSRYECLGKAGSIFIFDSNGLHRGNRSLGQVRDTIICSFNVGRYQWKFDISNKIFQKLSLKQRDYLSRNKRINIFQEN